MSTQRLPCERAGILRFLLALQFFLVELPRWLLLAVIVYAPWAFGCTRWWAKTLLILSKVCLRFPSSGSVRCSFGAMAKGDGSGRGCRAVSSWAWLVVGLQLARNLR
jgi:hypothetical protein